MKSCCTTLQKNERLSIFFSCQVQYEQGQSLFLLRNLKEGPIIPVCATALNYELLKLLPYMTNLVSSNSIFLNGPSPFQVPTNNF